MATSGVLGFYWDYVFQGNPPAGGDRAGVMHDSQIAKGTRIADINDYVLDQYFTYAVSNNPVWWITSNKFHGLTPTLHQGFLWTDAWLDA